jgi:hypothetical protein
MDILPLSTEGSPAMRRSEFNSRKPTTSDVAVSRVVTQTLANIDSKKRLNYPSQGEQSSDLSEVFHCIVFIWDRNRRARIGQAECCARTVFKIDFELRLGLMNGILFSPRKYRCRSGCLDLHA